VKKPTDDTMNALRSANRKAPLRNMAMFTNRKLIRGRRVIPLKVARGSNKVEPRVTRLCNKGRVFYIL